MATGYGTKPPKAKATVHPSCERHGAVFVWFDEAGRAPLWEIPALPTEGWSDLKTHTFRLRGHPQDTTENSVDIGHLRVVHGYESVEQLSELATDGPYLTARYAMTRPLAVLGRRATAVKAEFEVHVHGLGYSFVEVLVKSGGFETRNFVFATPVDDALELRIAMSLEAWRTRRRCTQCSARCRKPSPSVSCASRRSAPIATMSSKTSTSGTTRASSSNPRSPKAMGPSRKCRKWASQFYTGQQAS